MQYVLMAWYQDATIPTIEYYGEADIANKRARESFMDGAEVIVAKIEWVYLPRLELRVAVASGGRNE